ncbi:glycoside hydrolase family 3 N-terminal domain-containing protein [Oscillospiraceae bacterium 38-13]
MRIRLIRILLAALCAALLLTACGRDVIPPPPEEPEIPAPPPEPEEVLSPEEALLRSMTLEEKAGQVFFVRAPGEGAAEDIALYHLGGYLLFGQHTREKTASALIQMLDSYQAAAVENMNIPLLIGVDEEGGTVVRVSSNPHLRSKKFSSPRKLLKNAEDGWTALEEETREKAMLLKALGINVNLAPVADLSEDPGDFIYDRSAGGDPEAVFQYASRVVGIHSEYGLGSVLKHFPGYGNNRDTHNGIAVDNRPMEEFRQRDFLPFQRFAALENPPAILVSHTIVNCMDPELPASLSPEVHRVLREELGFDGVVMTDDLAMDAVKAYAADGAVAALQAGNDLVIAADYRTQIPLVIEAVENGTLEEAVLDAACLRVLRWKMALGLLEVSEDGELVPR